MKPMLTNKWSACLRKMKIFYLIRQRSGWVLQKAFWTKKVLGIFLRNKFIHWWWLYWPNTHLHMGNNGWGNTHTHLLSYVMRRRRMKMRDWQTILWDWSIVVSRANSGIEICGGVRDASGARCTLAWAVTFFFTYWLQENISYYSLFIA